MDDGVETRFVYDGWRVVEERDDQDNVLASYVHDGYIDDVVSMRSTVLGGDPRDWFFHSDDQFSVVLLTNDEGEAVERVGYDAWGTPTFQRVANGATASVSFFGNPYAFTGRRWEPPSQELRRPSATEQVYHYRLRTFDPAIGRFTTRDPIGIWGDPLNLGNGYTYTGNNPWSWLDPFGLQGWSLWGDRPQLGDRCKTLVNDGTVPDYGNDFGMRRAEAITGLVVDTYEHAKHAEAVGEEIAKEGIQYAAEEAATGPIPVATIRRVGKAVDKASDAVRATDKFEASTSAVRVNLSRAKYPESAAHIEKAREAGHPSVLTLDRSDASQRRAQALHGLEKVPGMHLDEYPPAMFKDGGQGASVCPISPADNMGSGATIGNALRRHEDGTKVIIELIE